MTSKLKCPFCQQELVRHWGMKEPALYCCDNPKCSRGGVATESAWQELIRTRKALDVAMKGLYDIFTTRPNGCALNSMKAKETMDKVKRLVGTNNTSVSSADLLAYQDHQSMPIKTALEQKEQN